MDYQQIILQGDALIADINAAAAPAPGSFHLWWLGQHSFIAKLGAAVIYIDAFLTPMEGRLCPPLLTPSQCTNTTLFCGTHDHADHIDHPAWPGMAKASPGAKFVVPQLLLDRGLGGALGIKAERFVGLDDGQSVEIEGVKITALAAAHEFFDRDPVAGKHPYLGLVFECNGVTLYHAGDTVWYEGLQTKLRKWKKFDVMMVPINGRDANRLRENIIGNMTYQEAADLCGPLSPGLVIPAHYDMFAGNPGDPEAFIDYMSVKYPKVKTHRGRYGERIEGPRA
ncbi:MAG: MBL fold metallo-hydrolase [Phycisphaeraceae bacterium]